MRPVNGEKMTDVSAAQTITRYPEQKEGPSNARTPDNNDVPITRELNFAGRSDVALGDSLKPNSFLQSSDSLDNNCILNGESVGADFDEDLDRFEGETVARFREELFLSQKPLTDTELRAIASAVSSAKFHGEKSQEHVNRRKHKSYIGYYSEYFDVHKPMKSKDIVDENSVEVPQSGSTGKSESITPSVETWRKSFRKKEISKLISYFETEVSKLESSPDSMDFKNKIFEEVSAIRDRERQKSSKLIRCEDQRVAARHAVSESARRGDFVESKQWKSQGSHDSPEDNFEPDSLEPVRRSSVTFSQWSSPRGQGSECSSCVGSPEVPFKPGKATKTNYSQYQVRPSSDRSHAGLVCVSRHLESCPGSLEHPQKTFTSQTDIPSSTGRCPGGSSDSPDPYSPESVEPEGSSVNSVSADWESSRSQDSDSSCVDIPDPASKSLRANQAKETCSSSKRWMPSSNYSSNKPESTQKIRTLTNQHIPLAKPRTVSPAKVCSSGQSVMVANQTPSILQRDRRQSWTNPGVDQMSIKSTTSKAENKLESTSHKTRDNCSSSMKLLPDQTSHMQLDLLSPGDLSDVSPSIITPPIGFQNCFPPKTAIGQASVKPLQDAELFHHVSVKNLRNKLSPQDSGWSRSAPYFRNITIPFSNLLFGSNPVESLFL